MSKPATQEKESVSFPDPFANAQRIAKLSIRLQDALAKLAREQDNVNLFTQNLDPFNLRPAIMKFWEEALEHPASFMEAQYDLMNKNMQIWQSIWGAFFEGKNITEAAAKMAKRDRRFKNELWQNNPFFAFLKEAYFVTAQWILSQVQNTDDMDEETRTKLQFFTKQYIDALSPSNFPLSNPEIWQKTIETGGENLIEGLENLVEDLENHSGQWMLRTTDKSAFKVGENLAVTKGSVVFENELMQLIQYAPTTKQVHKTPLLIVPPWINKYYILDMRQENSFVKWLVDQGHTVFMVSWVNPDSRHRDINFEHYMTKGLFPALDHIESLTGEEQTNVIGYCIGGTLLTCALAIMAERKQDHRIKSATFLTTLVDFQNSGDLKVFIDEEQIAYVEDRMAEQGYLDAAYLKATFAMIRANDMIWSFVINNYMLGRDPFPFDLLYWNDDSVNLPAKMQSYYLRNMYLHNRVIKPDALSMDGTKIDIRKVKTPSYFLSTREDHIAPWRATFETTKYFKGPCTFTLAASGHVAGVVNAPGHGKYGHWTHKAKADNPDAWLEKAKKEDGSWWPHWDQWVAEYAGEKIPARKPKGEIEPAPGRYVKGER